MDVLCDSWKCPPVTYRIVLHNEYERCSKYDNNDVYNTCHPVERIGEASQIMPIRQ